MRLFIGIEIPEELKKKIADSLEVEKKDGKQWEKHADYHLTLLFLGETTEEKMEEVKERMRIIKFTPFHLQMNGIEFFNRRIMYMGLRPSDELLALKQQVDELFPDYIRENEKEFIPHMTLKRWQRWEREYLQRLAERFSARAMQFTVSRLALFKSARDTHNNKYHVLFTVSARQG